MTNAAGITREYHFSAAQIQAARSMAIGGSGTQYYPKAARL